MTFESEAINGAAVAGRIRPFESVIGLLVANA